MSPIDLIVIDVGNSQCKVGLVQGTDILQVHTLALDDCAYQPWRQKVVHSLLGNTIRWVLSGSNPPIITRFSEWLKNHEQQQQVITSESQLPLKINVEYPERVGRDRLLNALAVPRKPAIIISAGSAVTVDKIDAEGSFQGGAIFPGLRLMAKSLHDYTARLPLIDAARPEPPLPGKNTEDAMHAGIIEAVLGGIIGCVVKMKRDDDTIFVTGGDGPTLAPHLPWPVEQVPWLALQGLVIASRVGS
jgi:type III pantothenate kinase